METESPTQTSPKEDQAKQTTPENGNSNQDATTELSNEDRALQEALDAAEREYQRQMELDAKQNESKKEEQNQEDEEEEEEPKEEENEEDEAAGFIAPVIDGRTISFKTRMLNEFLLCSLCMGYFRDANTVKECLHTFCKSCIYKWFMEHADCPRCGVSLGTNPFDLVKFDRQLQTIVDKILPHLEKADLNAEKEFYKERGIPFDEPVQKTAESGVKRANENDNEEDKPEPKKIKKSEALKKFYSDEIGFELNLDESEKDKSLGKLEKPFIRTSAKVTVMHLKKYLKQKLGIDIDDYNQMEITYRGEVLGNEHSLEYILKSRGGFDSQGNKTPNFKYRFRRTDIL